ncbi:unnamed protein product, partial [Prorocentrum cordatum]
GQGLGGRGPRHRRHRRHPEHRRPARTGRPAAAAQPRGCWRSRRRLFGLHRGRGARPRRSGHAGGAARQKGRFSHHRGARRRQLREGAPGDRRGVGPRGGPEGGPAAHAGRRPRRPAADAPGDRGAHGSRAPARTPLPRKLRGRVRGHLHGAGALLGGPLPAHAQQADAGRGGGRAHLLGGRRGGALSAHGGDHAQGPEAREHPPRRAAAVQDLGLWVLLPLWPAAVRGVRVASGGLCSRDGRWRRLRLPRRRVGAGDSALRDARGAHALLLRHDGGRDQEADPEGRVRARVLVQPALPGWAVAAALADKGAPGQTAAAGGPGAPVAGLARGRGRRLPGGLARGGAGRAAQAAGGRRRRVQHQDHGRFGGCRDCVSRAAGSHQ